MTHHFLLPGHLSRRLEYFGNDNPARQTYLAILPKIRNSLNFSKQFRLSKSAKARVIEIFHASRLWYAAKFYPIPPTLDSELQQAFCDYINYPHKTVTIKREELYKLREHRGAKFVHVQAKSEASKVQWLIDLYINPTLSGQLAFVTELLGDQKGKLHGSDLFDEVALRDSGRPHRSPLTNLFDKLAPPDVAFLPFRVLLNSQPCASGSCMPPSSSNNNRDHNSSTKGVLRLQTPVEWDKVWATVHNCLATEDTKSVVGTTSPEHVYPAFIQVAQP